MKIGNSVRLVQPTIGGTIIDTEYDKSSHELRHLVEWEEDGVIHQRWFTESQLETM